MGSWRFASLDGDPTALSSSAAAGGSTAAAALMSANSASSHWRQVAIFDGDSSLMRPEGRAGNSSGALRPPLSQSRRIGCVVPSWPTASDGRVPLSTVASSPPPAYLERWCLGNYQRTRERWTFVAVNSSSLTAPASAGDSGSSPVGARVRVAYALNNISVATDESWTGLMIVHATIATTNNTAGSSSGREGTSAWQRVQREGRWTQFIPRGHIWLAQPGIFDPGMTGPAGAILWGDVAASAQRVLSHAASVFDAILATTGGDVRHALATAVPSSTDLVYANCTEAARAAREARWVSPDDAPLRHDRAAFSLTGGDAALRDAACALVMPEWATDVEGPTSTIPSHPGAFYAPSAVATISRGFLKIGWRPPVEAEAASGSSDAWFATGSPTFSVPILTWTEQTNVVQCLRSGMGRQFATRSRLNGGDRTITAIHSSQDIVFGLAWTIVCLCCLGGIAHLITRRRGLVCGVELPRPPATGRAAHSLGFLATVWLVELALVGNLLFWIVPVASPPVASLAIDSAWHRVRAVVAQWTVHGPALALWYQRGAIGFLLLTTHQKPSIAVALQAARRYAVAVLPGLGPLKAVDPPTPGAAAGVTGEETGVIASILRAAYPYVRRFRAFTATVRFAYFSALRSPGRFAVLFIFALVLGTWFPTVDFGDRFLLSTRNDPEGIDMSRCDPEAATNNTTTTGIGHVSAASVGLAPFSAMYVASGRTWVKVSEDDEDGEASGSADLVDEETVTLVLVSSSVTLGGGASQLASTTFHTGTVGLITARTELVAADPQRPSLTPRADSPETCEDAGNDNRTAVPLAMAPRLSWRTATHVFPFLRGPLWSDPRRWFLPRAATSGNSLPPEILGVDTRAAAPSLSSTRDTIIDAGGAGLDPYRGMLGLFSLNGTPILLFVAFAVSLETVGVSVFTVISRHRLLLRGAASLMLTSAGAAAADHARRAAASDGDVRTGDGRTEMEEEGGGATEVRATAGGVGVVRAATMCGSLWKDRHLCAFVLLPLLLVDVLIDTVQLWLLPPALCFASTPDSPGRDSSFLINVWSPMWSSAVASAGLCGRDDGDDVTAGFVLFLHGTAVLSLAPIVFSVFRCVVIHFVVFAMVNNAADDEWTTAEAPPPAVHGGVSQRDHIRELRFVLGWVHFLTTAAVLPPCPASDHHDTELHAPGLHGRRPVRRPMHSALLAVSRGCTLSPVLSTPTPAPSDHPGDSPTSGVSSAGFAHGTAGPPSGYRIVAAVIRLPSHRHHPHLAPSLTSFRPSRDDPGLGTRADVSLIVSVVRTASSPSAAAASGGVHEDEGACVECPLTAAVYDHVREVCRRWLAARCDGGATAASSGWPGLGGPRDDHPRAVRVEVHVVLSLTNGGGCDAALHQAGSPADGRGIRTAVERALDDVTGAAATGGDIQPPVSATVWHVDEARSAGGPRAGPEPATSRVTMHGTSEAHTEAAEEGTDRRADPWWKRLSRRLFAHLSEPQHDDNDRGIVAEEGEAAGGEDGPSSDHGGEEEGPGPSLPPFDKARCKEVAKQVAKRKSMVSFADAASTHAYYAALTGVDPAASLSDGESTTHDEQQQQQGPIPSRESASPGVAPRMVRSRLSRDDVDVVVAAVSSRRDAAAVREAFSTYGAVGPDPEVTVRLHSLLALASWARKVNDALRRRDAASPRAVAVLVVEFDDVPTAHGLPSCLGARFLPDVMAMAEEATEGATRSDEERRIVVGVGGGDSARAWNATAAVGGRDGVCSLAGGGPQHDDDATSTGTLRHAKPSSALRWFNPLDSLVHVATPLDVLRHRSAALAEEWLNDHVYTFLKQAAADPGKGDAAREPRCVPRPPRSARDTELLWAEVFSAYFRQASWAAVVTRSKPEGDIDRRKADVAIDTTLMVPSLLLHAEV